MTELRTACVSVSMIYDPQVSVNSAYNRNNPRLGHRKRVIQWLTVFKCRFMLARGGMIRLPVGPVKMDITICRSPRRGRLPDTSNFRKLPQDVAAAALGVDDSVFFGTDHSILTIPKSEEDTICFDFVWEYEAPGKARAYKPTKMSAGPLDETLMRRMGVKAGTVCMGFGSAYCMICGACPEDCPVQYSPEVYVKDNCPCSGCTRACPCKGQDPGYEERSENILAWWQAKVAGMKFETNFWRSSDN